MFSQEVVVEVCPQCREIHCEALFGKAWFKSPGINPDIPRHDKLCPYCDSLMPLIKRLEFRRRQQNGQLELFGVL